MKKFLSFLFIDGSLKAEIEFLKKIPLFFELSDRTLSKIALLIFKKSYQPQEKIFQDGKEAEVLYIVKSGKVKIFGNGVEKVLDEGSFFGEKSLIASQKHKYSAESLENSLLYLIYRVKLDDLFDSDYKAGFKIMKNLLLIETGRSTIHNS